MALTVIKRPQGYIANRSTSFTATFAKSTSTTIFTKASHGFINGQIIYVESNFDGVNGFQQVENITVNTFYLQQPGTAGFFYIYGGTGLPVSGSITYYLTTASHNWNSIHLPIIYQLRSTLWPNNLVDTGLTVSSYANDNGYVKLTLSGALKSDVTELEFVKVTFTGGTSAVYQILTWYSNSIVTINLAYIGGITFTLIQYYYNNYHARIRVYAGLSTSHYLASSKALTLVTEQEVIPESSGFLVININEFLKEQIEIFKNNLALETLQNNIDAFCQFYITYAEAYDYSVGGYTLLDYIGPYTDDSSTFIGFAVNAQLPFKNINSGSLSDYVYGSSATKLKFLTPSIYPELVQDQYFDISFINQIGALLRIRRECLQNGVIVASFIDLINDYGTGIYRYELARSIYLEDHIYLTLEFFDYSSWIPISETKDITVNSQCSYNQLNISWLNYLGGFDYWVFKSNSDYGVDVEKVTTSEKNIFTSWPKSYGKGADTIKQETSRSSRQSVIVRAENLTANQINDLFRIKTSSLVQVVTSRTDKRTVLVDSSDFIYYQQSEKLFTLQFRITYTDLLPNQSL